MDDGDQRTFLAGLSILMSWRLASRFRARVLHRLGDATAEVLTYDLDANPRELSYRVESVKTARIDSFDWASRRRVESGIEVSDHVSALNPEPFAARLAFPLSLGVWGRNIDEYRFIGDATDDGKLIHLGVVHTKAPDITGALSIDIRRRHAVRLDTPIHLLAYESIEPLG